ncbi:peroxisomal acyl-CoA oxidase 1-like protein, partial [Trifolium pratense]
AEDWLNPNAVLGAFEARAARKSVACAKNLSKFSNPEEGEQGYKNLSSAYVYVAFNAAWSDMMTVNANDFMITGFQELSNDLVEAARAHCQLIVVSKFIEKLQQDIPGKGVKQQLQILCSIYALFHLHKHLGDFLSTGCITPKQGSLANDQLRSLYSQVRPNAIALVDAFNYTDHYLSSILGCYDGNVYPKLYEAAWKDPLNDSVVPDGFQEYIRPMLKQQLQVPKQVRFLGDSGCMAIHEKSLQFDVCLYSLVEAKFIAPQSFEWNGAKESQEDKVCAQVQPPLEEDEILEHFLELG